MGIFQWTKYPEHHCTTATPFVTEELKHLGTHVLIPNTINMI